MADVEKSAMQERHQQLDRVSTKEDEHSDHKPLAPVETLVPVDIHNSQAFKGDDSDGQIHWTIRKWFAAAFLAMLYTGSQILLYFTGGTLSYIAADLGGESIIGWLPVANTLAIASICPFVGYLQDLFGKRYIAIAGACCLIIGCSVMATAHSFTQGIVGQAFAGAGAGIGELTGLAGLAETVPVKHRGYSLAVLTAFVLPFCPYVLYSQLFSTQGTDPTWRWGAWISLIYNAVTAVGLLITYFPHAHVRAEGMSRSAIIKRIDFIGGFLSITGLALFLVALQSGGYTHPWTSAYVLCCLLIGLALLFAWGTYEWKFAKYPMVPKELFLGQRVVALSFAVAFVAGMNFFSLLNFWPLTISTVWPYDPILIGYRGLSAGFGTAIGAIFWNALLSTFPADCKWILFAAAGMLTTFGGALAVMTPDNIVTTIALATVACFGLGGVIVPAATLAMIAAPDALITTCAALSLSVRAVGGSIGYSIYFSIFHKKFVAIAPLQVATYAVGAGLPLEDAPLFVETLLTNISAIATVPGFTPETYAAGLLGQQWGYALSLHYVWYTSIAFGLLAMLAAICLPKTGKFQTNRIAVELS